MNLSLNKSFQIKSLAAAIVMLFFFLCAGAQQTTGSLRGFIVGADKQALEGITIQLSGTALKISSENYVNRTIL